MQKRMGHAPYLLSHLLCGVALALDTSGNPSYLVFSFSSYMSVLLAGDLHAFVTSVHLCTDG